MSKISTKTPLKEKVVQIYESFLKGEDPFVGNANFWAEFFLLRANVSYLEHIFEELQWEEIVKLKGTISLIFHQCVSVLKDKSHIRIVNSIQTMCALVRGVHSKAVGDFSLETIQILMGFNYAEQQMKILIDELALILSAEYPGSLKNLVLKFFLILVTVDKNVNRNKLFEFLMTNSIFEAIIQILQNPKSRQYHGYDAVLLLTILVNYKKHDVINPYIVKLSIVDSEMALNGFGQVIASALAEFNRKFGLEGVKLSNQSGFFSSLTTFVGGMFMSENSDKASNVLRVNNAVLLAFYAIVHLNRNFLITLTNCQTDLGLPQLGCSGVNSNISADLAPPSNLLVTFLEFCSIVMQNTKEENSVNTCKLCFIILTCIAEDQYANSIMHDLNLVYKVHLHKMPMRHRRLSSEHEKPSRPLSCSVMDLMVEFILSHMTKCLPFELYHLCLGVIQRILCYQKRNRLRLQYNWKDLWTALISLMKFLMSQESLLTNNCNIFHLSSQAVNVLNLFITFGDTFLPSTSHYDDLYYEIMRMNHVFDNLYSMALRYTTNDSEWKDSAARLTNSLVNIRAIINHFSPKIEAWSTENHITALTEDQVMDVVKSNYDTLTLKLYDNLDQYERYCEKPKEAIFFASMLRLVVSEYRMNLSFKSLEMQSVIQEFSALLL